MGGPLKTMARPRTSSLFEAVEADDAKMAGEGKEACKDYSKQLTDDEVMNKLVAQVKDSSFRRAGSKDLVKFSGSIEAGQITEDDIKAAIQKKFCSAANACKLLFQKMFPGQGGEIISKGGVKHTV